MEYESEVYWYSIKPTAKTIQFWGKIILIHTYLMMLDVLDARNGQSLSKLCQPFTTRKREYKPGIYRTMTYYEQWLSGTMCDTPWVASAELAFSWSSNIIQVQQPSTNQRGYHKISYRYSRYSHVAAMLLEPKKTVMNTEYWILLSGSTSKWDGWCCPS